MRIVQLRGPFKTLHDSYGTVKDSTIYKHDSIGDADLLIVSTRNEVFSRYYMVDFSLDRFTKAIAKCREEIEYHLSSGRDIFVFLEGQMEAKISDIDDFGVQISYPLEAETVAYKNLLPGFEELISEKKTGLNIIAEPDISKQYINNLGGDVKFKYYCILNPKELDVILFRAKNSKKVVSGIKFYKSGRVFYLPSIEKDEQRGATDDTANFELIKNFIGSLQIKQKTNDIYVEPKWLERYQILNQKELEDEHKELAQKMHEIQLRIDIINSELSDIKMTKSILVSTGDFLEKQVRDIFEEIGFEVQETNVNNRVDLILKHIDQVIVCEIKGLKGSAGERNAVQLEKWISNYRLNHDGIAKGLLIVAGYREIEISKRTDPIFPHAMAQYVKQRNQLCINTDKLLALYIQYKKEEMSKTEIWDFLYTSVGLIE